MSSATLPMCGKSSQISWPDLAEFLEAVLRAEADQRLALQLRDLLALGERFRHGLAVHLGELRLVVEGLQVRRAARLIEEDDALGLGRMMQRIDRAARCRAARAISEFSPSRPRPEMPWREERAAVEYRDTSSGRIVSQFLVIVSCILRMARATVVIAANSAVLAVRPAPAPHPRESTRAHRRASAGTAPGSWRRDPASVLRSSGAGARLTAR